MNAIETTTLTVMFRPPGGFLTDTRLVVSLDGAAIYDGSFTSGFERQGPITPGVHRLETLIDAGIVQRRKHYTFEITPARAWLATLDYSRFWGNFARKLELWPY